MKCVIGIDLGTSAVKLLLMNQKGKIIDEVSKSYPVIQEKAGYSEQDPQSWVEQTAAGLSDLLRNFKGNPEDIEGISFSGQMHGLVLLDENNEVLRPAILWNDTRTTEECRDIYEALGEERLLAITKNPALEGFTLPKLLWVKKHEPKIYEKAKTFVLPKDYVRYKLTGELHMDYSDAAGTLLMDISKKEWSKEICDILGIDEKLCPPLVASYEKVGNVTSEMAISTGLSASTAVIAGGADNACGAIGSGILEDGKTLCSIGTSGVVLSYESSDDKDFQGRVHYFNHGTPDGYYTMGVTLAAGDSLSWFKEVSGKDESFEEWMSDVGRVPAGSNGLLFTPYVSGERTPHADAAIRASFIGMDRSHERKDFIRAVMEGITFSLNESLAIFRGNGKEINTIVSIGGGTKNEEWLQMQADIFNAKIVKLASEQGPGVGAAMLGAYGCGWFPSLKECAAEFISVEKEFLPDPEKVKVYKALFEVYQDVYQATKSMNDKLVKFRK
ncbi:xylulokinase [Bacillus sp. KH172YL63]|uniref:xylulokinase n=1 Tax=Bacillus sp. KH172YL63 TaxID=2709784 RepID=UPI0013E42031|nr:xylulokinase [Bacillus sp. KH172YL63]BCB02518.1 xylulose kinase [Bacillus sp. KH172YL63]